MASTSRSTYSERDITKWFINAKRSLSAMSLGARANELVYMTRMDLQRATVTSARCVFIRRALQDQVNVLLQMKQMMTTARKAAMNDFEKGLKDLDDANTRLDNVLSALGDTEVDKGFNEAEQPEQRSLHDFVDDEGVENLRTNLRNLIDQIQTSGKTYTQSLESFDQSLETLLNAMKVLPTPVSSGSLPPASSLSPSLLSLEEQASAMASLLESLARHYDQCCMALKQSEAGNRNIGSMELDAGSQTELEGERQEMLEVLEKDAGEVDDVINELQERLADMEQIGAGVTKFTADLDGSYKDTLTAFSYAERFEGELLIVISRTKEFQQQHSEFQRVMADKLGEMDRLVDHYVLFAEAYDGLLIEVDRRLEVQRRKEAIINEALSHVDALNEKDMMDRETFKLDYGEYLPADIWLGLSNPPMTYDVVPHQALPLPVLGSQILRDAMARRSQRR